MLSLILLRDEKKFRHLDKNIEHRYKAAAAAVAAAVAGSLGFSASVHPCGRKIAGHEQNSMDCKGRKKTGEKGKRGKTQRKGDKPNQERWRNSAGFQPSKTCFRQTETGKTKNTSTPVTSRRTSGITQDNYCNTLEHFQSQQSLCKNCA